MATSDDHDRDRSARRLARRGGLRYVHDTQPGYTRRRRGRGFSYHDERGRLIRSAEVRARIEAIVIPPAWTQVWICPLATGHIQATGRDARGRKQYRYHPLWTRLRNEAKFDRLTDFVASLSRMRAITRRDLRRPPGTRRRVLAGVVRLLEETCIRVGNDEYARTNESYGLTTIRNEHVETAGSEIIFSFRGKRGIDHVVRLDDPRLAEIVRNCQNVPGDELFAYRDSTGRAHDIDSLAVNDYIRQISGGPFTAKDFRTWSGTYQAARELQQLGPGRNQTARRRNQVAAVKRVATCLRNRPTTCRKYYIHPVVLRGYEEGWLLERLRRRPRRRRAEQNLALAEVAVARVLERPGA